MTIRRRIVLATRIFTPEPAAASFRLQALADALTAAGHEVTVLTTAPPAGTLRARHDEGAGPQCASSRGPRVKRWPVLRDKQGYVRGYLPYLSFDLPLALRLLLTRADVVVAEPPPTTGAVVRAVAALKRVPYVYYAADVWSDAAALTGAPRPVVAALRRLEGWVLRGAARVIAVSDDVASRLGDLGFPRAAVVRNGIDTATFTPEGPTREPGGYFLYAGTASEWQGAHVFIRALAQTREHRPEARLVYIGQGSAWDELRALADRLVPGAVQFHPTMPPTRVAEWQRGARAAVVSIVPGVGYDFAYPTKVLAALASGTPVIYAGTGPAAADITEHRLGWAVPYEVDAVAAAMIHAWDGRIPGEPPTATPANADARKDAAGARLARWVQEHRSLRRTGEQAAAVVLAALRRR